MSPEIMWSILGIALIIIELLTVSFFAIFLAIGAFAAGICAFITDNVTIQIIIFVVVSTLAFIFGKPFLSKFFKINKEVRASTINAIEGQTGIVVKEILPNYTGQVKVDGAIWTAISENNTEISEGTVVKIIKITGVKLIVTPDQN